MGNPGLNTLNPFELNISKLSTEIFRFIFKWRMFSMEKNFFLNRQNKMC